MAINFKTTGIHHIALRCTDMSITKKIYQNIPGFTLVPHSPEIIRLLTGTVIIALKKTKAETGKDVFNPFNTGLDHVALACSTEKELIRVAGGLREAGVENTGVKPDETLQKKYVALKDPDRIQWKLNMI